MMVLSLTFRKQELDCAQVTLTGCHHEQGPALLVTDVDVGPVLQQQLCDLSEPKTHDEQILFTN